MVGYYALDSQQHGAQVTDQRLGKLAAWVTRNNLTVVKLDSTQQAYDEPRIKNKADIAKWGLGLVTGVLEVAVAGAGEEDTGIMV